MAYTIDKYSTGQLTVIEDGTVDQTTDLKLVGKNYAGYGEIQNENFVYLLENFAGSASPPRAIAGQLWFDTGNSKLKFYDGFQWRTSGGAEVNINTPTGLKEGDLWWNGQQLKVYDGTNFVLIGPQAAGAGQTQIVSRTVNNNQGGSNNIITAVVNDEVVFTISSNEFTIDSTDAENAISGFDRIRQGITLKNTLAANSGVTSGDWRLWGTASNSDKLEGKTASDFVTSAGASFSNLASFADAGLQIGDSGDFALSVESLTTNAVIANNVGTQIVINVKDDGGIIRNPIRFFSDSVNPGFDTGTNVRSVTLGEDDRRWERVYANEFDGLALTAKALKDVGTQVEYLPALTAGINTVALRDGLGDIYANVFQGIASEAKYADLAEKYTTDADYPVGTVMAVATQGTAEARSANRGSIAIGVVSAEPAYLMNSEAEGQAIGLKGRVPVRIVGTVNKGDAVYVDDNGCASTAINGGCLVGIALESNSSEEEKLVECVLKV
jgi:hypothetical protein